MQPPKEKRPPISHKDISRYIFLGILFIAVILFSQTGRYSYMAQSAILDTLTGDIFNVGGEIIPKPDSQ